MGFVYACAVPHPPLIIPTIGKGAEDGIAATVSAYKRIASDIAAAQPDSIILLSSHAPAYRDGFYVSKAKAASASMADFNAPQEHFDVNCDQELASSIRAEAESCEIPTCGFDPNGNTLDHASFIPLWFLRNALAENGSCNFEEADACSTQPSLPPIVRIGLSWLSFETHRRFGRALANAVEASGKRVALIASGDLSHRLLADGPYGYRAEGPIFDKRIVDIFTHGKLNELFEIDSELADKSGECGLRPFMIMAGALESIEVESNLLSYEGPYGVGYAVASFVPVDCLDIATNPDPFVALARASVEHYVNTGTPLPRPRDLPDELLSRRAGAFVSLHKHGALRGCIGTINACTSCLADEIIANGISAATQDPRFPAIQPAELDSICYSVDVLSPAEPIQSETMLDPKHYGVIVTKDFRRGLLLPNLDGIDTIEQQISIARAKAGISEWERGVKLQRFEVVRHETGGEARDER